MTKTRKILIIVLVCILALLIIAASVLAAYAVGLYNKMNYDPNANFAPSVEVNEALQRAYDKLNEGVSIDEVIKDPELTPEQIAILQNYAASTDTRDPNYTGTDTPISSITPPNIEPPVSTDGIMNILFLGTDERPGEVRARSDSMIVVSINTNTKQITLTSLMRDMYIELVGLGRNNKLNAAYQFGGVKMLNDTIKTYLGIETDNYVRVGFESFQTIIDAIGGVDVPLSSNKTAREQEIKRLKNYTDFSEKQLVAGTEYTYHLTGEQALYYCRDRYSGAGVSGVEHNDFGRTERQRKVLSAVVKKAQSLEFNELLSALPEILPLVTTDLSLGDCTKLLTSVATTYKQYTIQNFRIPADKTWNNATINGSSVLEVDYAKNAKLWRELVYGQ